ncbi:MAG: hypothetical protein H0T60_04775 [Acidobacteria bacterium]|nr:hypothetical protein [Acidobacteriota bacterium]
MTKKKVRKNWVEWVVFGVGLALVAGTLGFLVYDGASAGGDAPPDLRIELGEATRRGESFVVPVTVKNVGGQTAEGVTVEVSLERDGSPPEQGEFGIAFLPRGGKREGFVTFNTDPSGSRLVPRVLGYEKP